MKTFMTIIAILAVAFGFACLEAWLGMLIVNWVVGLFGGTWAITFWQSFGACILLGFVGGFFKGGSTSNKD